MSVEVAEFAGVVMLKVPGVVAGEPVISKTLHVTVMEIFTVGVKVSEESGLFITMVF